MTAYSVLELNKIAEEISIVLSKKDIPEKIITLGNILEYILRHEEIPSIFFEHFQHLVHQLTSGETVFNETGNGYYIYYNDNVLETVFETNITVTEGKESVDFDFESTTTQADNKFAFILTVSKEGINFRKYN